MFRKAISFAIALTLSHGSIAAQSQQQYQTQNVASMQQVLRRAQEKDKAVKVTLNKKIDNRLKLSGKVNQISDTGFIFSDQKTGKAMLVAYADVHEVRQKGMSKTTKILIVSGIVVAAVVGLGFALACSSEGGPNC